MTKTTDAESKKPYTPPTVSKRRGRPPKTVVRTEFLLDNSEAQEVDLVYGEQRQEKGKTYQFTYSCGDCGMKIKTVGGAYEQKVCGGCNRKLTVTKQERG